MTANHDPGKPRVPPARRLRRDSLIILGFLVLTAVMTWPWVRHLRDTVADEGDAYAHAYFLWWDYQQTFHDPRHLFDATIFYPYKNTLAFGENDYGIALVFFPLFALGLRPLTVYSIAAFLSFAFSGYGMFRLSRTLAASEPLAWVAGIVFAFLPYRYHHLSHLPLIFAGWIPLLCESLILFARERTWRRALWLGLTFFMNALTCVTWFILTLIPLCVSGIILLTRQHAWRDRVFWLRAGVCLGAALLLLLPFMLPFLRVAQVHGFVRSTAEVQAFSAQLRNWFAVDEGNRIWKSFGATMLDYEMALFPGFAVLVLALVGFVLSSWKVIRSWSSRTHDGTAGGAIPQTEIFIHALFWTVIGFLGSFGLNSFFHRFLYNYVPLFRSMRAAVRWSMIAYLGLAMLAGLGALYLAQFLHRRASRLPVSASLSVLVLFVLFDQWVRPFPLVRGQVDPDEVTLYLKAKTISGGIVELPAGDASPLYMLRAADHGHPLVTARNSFSPPIEQELERLTTSQPVPAELLDLLETIPASYLVVHTSFLSPERHLELESFLNQGLSTGRLRFIRSFNAGVRDGLKQRADLFAVVKTEPGTHTEGPAPPPVSRADLEPLFNGRLSDLQHTGYFAYRLYKAAYGRAPLFAEFMPELQALRYDAAAGSEKLAAAKETLVAALVERPEFKNKYSSLTDDQYVDVLLANTGLQPDAGDRDRLIAGLRGGQITRAAVLKEVIENNIFSVREFNRAFVLMHYFIYLKRDPDEGGFQFWLYKLDRHNDYAGFTEAFAASTERQNKLPQP